MKLIPTSPIGEFARPSPGWLRTLRGTLGLTLAELAQRLKVTPPAVRSFEQAEAEDRITLASLRRVADAMDCELIYALVPRSGVARPAADAAVAPSHSAGTTMDAPDADDSSKKVTDLTWHTLHGES
jgi:predicted DNA-binding mobile mystery protein A